VLAGDNFIGQVKHLLINDPQAFERYRPPGVLSRKLSNLIGILGEFVNARLHYVNLIATKNMEEYEVGLKDTFGEDDLAIAIRFSFILMRLESSM